MTLTKKEKELLWNILYSVRNCWDKNGKLVSEYYDNIVLTDLTEVQQVIFHNLVFEKLFY
jgi:hypothetical protein